MHNNGKAYILDNGLGNILHSIQKHMQVNSRKHMKELILKYGQAFTLNSLKVITQRHTLATMKRIMQYNGHQHTLANTLEHSKGHLLLNIRKHMLVSM